MSRRWYDSDGRDKRILTTEDLLAVYPELDGLDEYYDELQERGWLVPQMGIGCAPAGRNVEPGRFASSSLRGAERSGSTTTDESA